MDNQAKISAYKDFFNKRVRIDDYTGRLPDVLTSINESIPEWTEKLIIKSRANDRAFFLDHGLTQEAFVQGYFNGVDMYFLVKYYSAARSVNPKQMEEKRLVEKILKDEKIAQPADLKDASLATPEDANELAQLYASIFKVYPTPLGDPAHVQKTFDEGTIYVLIRDNNKIVSAASAEINRQYSNAELTDCATLPEVQGKGHIKKLLSKLEEVLRHKNIRCLYTIARAESYSMNKAFYQLNYKFGGLMINNCFIYSGLEDMNVWYKSTRA